jgi:hypothetical protein
MAWPGLDWIVVGGESGPGARPFDLAWAHSAVEQCRFAGVACFVKQIGARPQSTHPFGVGVAAVAEMVGAQSITTSGLQGATPDKAMFGYRLKDRKGGDMAEWPEGLRVRQFPGEATTA